MRSPRGDARSVRKSGVSNANSEWSVAGGSVAALQQLHGAVEIENRAVPACDNSPPFCRRQRVELPARALHRSKHPAARLARQRRLTWTFAAPSAIVASHLK